MRTQLTDKYRPSTVEQFIGIEGPRALMADLIARPFESAWYFLGPSGTGKTTLALATQAAMGGELHHVPSRQCNVASLQRLWTTCHYTPMAGGYHFVLIDEADQMTRDAQTAFLSILDGTSRPPNTIFIFTGNTTHGMQDRFLSRCRMVHFEDPSLLEPGAAFLAGVWKAEAGPGAPDFRELLANSNMNLRTALMNLELLLIAPGMRIAAPAPPPFTPAASASRREAALKAWQTIRARAARPALRLLKDKAK